MFSLYSNALQTRHHQYSSWRLWSTRGKEGNAGNQQKLLQTVAWDPPILCWRLVDFFFPPEKHLQYPERKTMTSKWKQSHVILSERMHKVFVRDRQLTFQTLQILRYRYLLLVKRCLPSVIQTMRLRFVRGQNYLRKELNRNNHQRHTCMLLELAVSTLKCFF